VRVKRIITSTIKDTFKYIKDRKLTKNTKPKFNELANGWVARLNSQPYHGGESPDAADFRVNFLIN
jgi:hypothetical protein